MITLSPRRVYCFAILLSLNVVAGFFNCNSDNCRDCASNTDAFGITCRWCRRDNECHTPGAFLTNPCKRAENIVDPSRCGEKFSHYDPELSLKMLLLSAAAYDPLHPQKCLDNSLPSADFQIQHTVTEKCDFFDNQCSGYVAVSHTVKVIAIAFRGSECLSQAFSVFVETLLSPKEAFLSKGKVQTYWKRGFETLWPSMESKVKALVADNPSYKIWVTGHSLGGAMASLASAWLSYYNIASREKIISYTFGMPRVGNYKYALEHDRLVGNSWRVVNYDDAVPHFPGVYVVPNMLFGPYHHGVEAFYSKPAISVYSEHRECHGQRNNEDRTCSLTKTTRSFERHKNYFSIPVGTFWGNECIHSTRKKRETSEKTNTTVSKRFQFVQDRCLKYKYINGSLHLPSTHQTPPSQSVKASASTMTVQSMHIRSVFCFLSLNIFIFH